MATDATGAPTSPDNIAKYVTSADAPSGKGFNAAMDSIQTALTNNYVRKTLLTTTGDIIYASGANTPARLGVGSTGQVLTVAGGVPTWGAGGGLKTTVSSWAGGPPVSPANTDVWIADVTAIQTGLAWMFTWNSVGSKWWFIGGGWLNKTDSTHTFVYSSGGANVDPSSTLTGVTPQTIARAGVYQVRESIVAQDVAGGGSHNMTLGIAKNGTAVTGPGSVATSVGNVTYVQLFAEYPVTVAASDTIGMVVNCGVNSINFVNASVNIQPLYIT